MQKEKNTNLVVYFLIIILFVGGIIYFTVYSKDNTAQTNQTTDQTNTNMTNTATNPTTTETVPGVKVTITKEGTGAIAKTGDTVEMNYTGTLADGTAFDSNVDPKFQHVQPFEFTIGAGQVIKGWDVGVAGMKVGEQRTLVLSPQYGYGAAGYPPVIPQNATLTFKVELVAIK